MSDTRCRKCNAEGAYWGYFVNWGYQIHTPALKCPSCNAVWTVPLSNDNGKSPLRYPNGRYDYSPEGAEMSWHPEGCLPVWDEKIL